MTMNSNFGRICFLSLLLLVLATSTTKNAEAKVVSSPNNHVVLPASSLATERKLEGEENDADGDVEDPFENYIPYDNGTPVRFDDQDGTWMFGVIWYYDTNTRTYTIEWDEDNVHEEFTDFGKVEKMVMAAKENNYNKIMNSGDYEREQEQGFDFDFDFQYDYDDLQSYEPWPIGTPTLLEFADGWFMGEIVKFTLSDDNINATYVVTWSDGTNDTFPNELEWMDLMVANAQDYEPWEIGTPTYGYPNAEGDSEKPFITGKITNFEKGAYSVTWSSGDVIVYYDFDMVDMLVNAAANNLDPTWVQNYDPWPKGTGVTWNFDDGWWNGNITDFYAGTYEVTWSDGSLKSYSNLEKIDQMVGFANGGGFQGNLAGNDDENGDDFYNDYYELETLVYAEFKDGWWAGYIDSYEDEYYVIRWSDNSVDKFLPGDDMDQMVIDGGSIPDDYSLWSEGTQVYGEFDGSWYWGTIEYSEGGFYTILWEDGSRTTYVSGQDIDDMVYNAYNTGFPFGRIILAIVLLTGVGGIAFYVIDRKRKMAAADIAQQIRENELDLAEGSYSDQEGISSVPSVV